MSHWQGIGTAPNYSREVERAYVAAKAAEEALFQALKAAYPLGSTVNVYHYSGTFRGEVVGWDHDGARVAVRNASSGKSKKWWAAHVELLGEQP